MILQPIVRSGFRALLILILFPCFANKGFSQGFINVAPSFGFDHLETGDTYCSGMSFFDFDQDGWDDLTFGRNEDSLLFYRNIGGSFVQLPSIAFGAGQVRQVLWADYDNDGDMDLLVTTFNGYCNLYNNDGNFVFTDVTAMAGLQTSAERYYGASFGDYDKDGFLDLYICNFVSSGNELEFNKLNHLYRNNGDGTFTNVTLAAGVGNGFKFSFGSIWYDYDMDGWPDLFVINDRWFANSLYRNNGDGTFTDMAEAAGVALPNNDPMTISLADMDNDGDMDIFLTNSGLADKHSMLLVNNGDGTFSEEAIQRGISVYLWAWAGAWVDFMNNGHQDLFIATAQPGFITDPNHLFGNLGQGQFVNANSMIQDSNARSFSAVIGDYDNNGFADIAVQNQIPHPPYLYKNMGNGGNFIKITLQGTISNKMAIGSYIRVFANGMMQTKYTLCGENYIGQSSQHMIFGIGNATTVDSVRIEYLSGHTDTYFALAVNQAYTFNEGETYSAQIVPQGSVEICPGSTLQLDGGDHAAWLWSTGHDGRYLTVSEAGEYSLMVWDPLGITATDTVFVSLHMLPSITATTSDPLCHGDASGSILLEAGGVDLAGVVWADQSVGPFIEGLTAGPYAYTFEDQNGCVSQGSVSLFDPLELFASAVSTPSTGSNGSIEITINGGNPPYTVLLNGLVTDPFIGGLAPGNYVAEVIDDHDCSVTLNVFVDLSTNINRLVSTEHRIHPNPVSDWFLIEGPVYDLVIRDIRGRVVAEHMGAVSGTVDVSELGAGPYTVSYRTNTGNILFQRMVKIP